jgi:hypothetical protein
MNKESLRSFVKLCKKGCVEDTVLVEYFSKFIESGSTDAYEWFNSQGLNNLCEPIPPHKLGKWIGEALIKGVEPIGYCMKMSGGRLDPSYVKNIYKEITDVYKEFTND